MKLNVKKENERLLEMMKINKTDLSGDMRKNPALIYRMGVLKSRAEKSVSRAESNLDIVKAKASRRIRLEKGKVTEKEISYDLSLNKKVIAANEEWIDSKHVFNMYKSAVKALDDKSTMLTNLSYNYRKELDHNIVKESREERVKEKFRTNKGDSDE